MAPKLSTETDQALLLAVRSASDTSDAAMGEIIQRYSRLAYTVALHVVNADRSLAEDAFQEAFLRLVRWLRAAQTTEVRSLKRLITVFTRRAAIDELRRISHHPENLPDLGYTPNIVDKIYAEEILNSLPDRMRKVIQATILSEYASHEVAKALGLTPEAVRQIKFRALTRLRRLQEADEDEIEVK